MVPRKVISCLVVVMALASLTAATNRSSAIFNMITAPITTKPGCQRKCGNVTVPYPFGIGMGTNCSIGEAYSVYCDESFNPPKPFFNTDFNQELLEISEINMRVRNLVANNCYAYPSGELTVSQTVEIWSQPFSFSSTLNKLTVVGSDYEGSIRGLLPTFTRGCNPYPLGRDLRPISCATGHGCCQIDIPSTEGIVISFGSFFNDTSNLLNQSCGYAFLGDAERFPFQSGVRLDSGFAGRVYNDVPIVMDWDVGNGTKCSKARKNEETYACLENTYCTDSDTASKGYRCFCHSGFEGNPYLSPGCIDIDECIAGWDKCVAHCTNTAGSYKCYCPNNHNGDGFRNGTGCVRDNSNLPLKTGLGTGFALLFVLIFISLLYGTMRIRRLTKMREKYFERNGGLLLQQQLASNHTGMQSTNIFTANELKMATKNYKEDCILGKGGYGTVYKGILNDKTVVAIKKSKVSDQTQIQQFINEMVILTGINHRHVVKMLGCCLEEEVPILVYEFISNGTLYELIHKKNSWLTWATCVRIASEAADALSYLHSDVSIPIIHRDVKSSNILIDATYTTKVSDFGISRLVPVDQTRVTTLVQGTLGYLDPEYFHTGQLTEKSDVYSFGVVLAELLTRKKPICVDKKIQDVNLAAHLVLAKTENRLLEIIHPQLIKEANKEQLVYLAKIMESCVSVRGEDRPTMKEVANMLKELRKNLKHPWLDESRWEGNSESLGHEHLLELDHYPTPNSKNHSSMMEGHSSKHHNMFNFIREKNLPR